MTTPDSLIPITLSLPAARIVRNKPLFVPLITKYYERFERGEKTSEIRRYGQRWNEYTCFVGREVVLSKGYGKKHRLKGMIVGVEIKFGQDLPEHHDDMLAVFGRYDIFFIIIHIQTPPLRLL